MRVYTDCLHIYAMYIYKRYLKKKKIKYIFYNFTSKLNLLGKIKNISI